MKLEGGTRYTVGQRQAPPQGLRAVLLDDSRAEAMAFMALASAGGWAVSWCEDGAELLRLMEKDSFDLVLLDWQLPGMSGYEVLLRLRERWPTQPVLMLTVNGSEADVVRALHNGADDYVTKPWRPHELLARMQRAVKPKVAASHGDQYPEQMLGLSFDAIRGHVFLADGEEIKLQRREFEVARVLFRHEGQVVSRSHLLNAVWHEKADDAEGGTRKVDTVVSRVRQKLKLTSEYGFILRSEWGVGYRLDAIVSPSG